jgi:hypothetical protein
MNDTQHSRRHFLCAGSAGLSSLALSYLLQQDEAQAKPAKPIAEKKSFDLEPKEPPFEPRAKAMISLWMQGGPSHHDLTDPKPLMKEWDGKTFPGEIKYDNAAQASSKVFATPWQFTPRGECGMELSELIPEIAGVADDICLIRSMKTGVNNHGQSIRALINGRILGGRPTIGSWLTYALGSETQNLPAYMALIDPGQLPVMGVENWSNGFLPAIYQGTVIRAQEPRILNLQPPQHLRGEVQDRSLAFLKKLNDKHYEQRPGQLDLEARIRSYELAARMQTAAAEAMDLSKESKSAQKMYGMMDGGDTAEYGSRCLIARRLVERGVRFVQVFTQNQLWDSHGSIISRLPAACKKVDKGSAALVADLKQLGLLDTTVVQWGGEMGRLPVIQNDAGRAKLGRDHNTYGFSHWYAGGGFKAGHVHGATDEWGHYAVEGTVNHFDIHATLMRLFGIDDKELTYRWGGRLQSLTDGQEGKVVEEVLS